MKASKVNKSKQMTSLKSKIKIFGIILQLAVKQILKRRIIHFNVSKVFEDEFYLKNN